MLRQRPKQADVFSKTTRISNKRDSRSMDNTGYKTTVGQLSKIFQTLKIDKAKSDLPPLMMHEKISKLEPMLRDEIFMKTVGKHLNGEGLSPTHECFICKQKGQSHAEHEMHTNGMQTGSKFRATNGQRARLFRTGNLAGAFNRNKQTDQRALMSRTLEIVDRSNTKNGNGFFAAGKRSEHPTIDLVSKSRNPSSKDFGSEMRLNFQGIEDQKGAIIISNEDHRNILDSLTIDRDLTASTLKPAIPKINYKSSKLQGDQTSSTQKLDLKRIRSEMQSQLKERANNDNERPYLDSVMRPRAREAIYYITEIKSKKLNSNRETPHLTHFSYMLKTLNNAKDFVLDSEQEFLDKKTLAGLKLNYLSNMHQLGQRVQRNMRGVRFQQVSHFVQNREKEPEEINKWIFFDLDEVLVYVDFDDIAGDFVAMLPSKQGPKKRAAVKIRPFLNEFLERIKEMYKLAIYTSSSRSYAEKIVELIDPHRTIFKAVLCAEYCLKIYKTEVGYS